MASNGGRRPFVKPVPAKDVGRDGRRRLSDGAIIAEVSRFAGRCKSQSPPNSGIRSSMRLLKFVFEDEQRLTSLRDVIGVPKRWRRCESNSDWERGTSLRPIPDRGTLRAIGVDGTPCRPGSHGPPPRRRCVDAAAERDRDAFEFAQHCEQARPCRSDSQGIEEGKVPWNVFLFRLSTTGCLVIARRNVDGSRRKIMLQPYSQPQLRNAK